MNDNHREIQSFETDVHICPDKFQKLNDDDKELLLESLSEKEKFSNLKNFKTLPNGKVGWNEK